MQSSYTIKINHPTRLKAFSLYKDWARWPIHLTATHPPHVKLFHYLPRNKWMAKLTISPFSISSRVYVLGQKSKWTEKKVIRIIQWCEITNQFHHFHAPWKQSLNNCKLLCPLEHLLTLPLPCTPHPLWGSREWSHCHDSWSCIVTCRASPKCDIVWQTPNQHV